MRGLFVHGRGANWQGIERAEQSGRDLINEEARRTLPGFDMLGCLLGNRLSCLRVKLAQVL